jgi:hypothetical protein
MRTAFFVVFLALAPVACGGSSFVSAGDASTGGDDGGSGGGPGDSGRASDGGGTNPDAGGGADAGPRPDAATCGDMEKQLADLRAKAQACAVGSDPTAQCQVSVVDVCCPFTADQSNQTAINEFKALLATYEAACGPFACPAIACVKTPSDLCGPLGACK